MSKSNGLVVSDQAKPPTMRKREILAMITDIQK
jgi:hypothetical protein